MAKSVTNPSYWLFFNVIFNGFFYETQILLDQTHILVAIQLIKVRNDSNLKKIPTFNDKELTKNCGFKVIVMPQISEQWYCDWYWKLPFKSENYFTKKVFDCWNVFLLTIISLKQSLTSSFFNK